MAEDDGRTALHYAALTNDLVEVEARLAAGDDPNVSDREGFTPLQLATQEGAIDVARLLVDHGANVNQTNIHGNGPLFTAVFNYKGDGSLIKLLRACGADPLRANRSGQTPADLAQLIANTDVGEFFNDLP